jgi:hypothetical protein
VNVKENKLNVAWNVRKHWWQLQGGDMKGSRIFIPKHIDCAATNSIRCPQDGRAVFSVWVKVLATVIVNTVLPSFGMWCSAVWGTAV